MRFVPPFFPYNSFLLVVAGLSLGAIGPGCGEGTDPAEKVRLSAYIAFRDIEPRADGAGYDYRTPTDAGLAALTKLAESP